LTGCFNQQQKIIDDLEEVLVDAGKGTHTSKKLYEWYKDNEEKSEGK